MDSHVTSPKKSSPLWIEIERRVKQVKAKKKITDDAGDCAAVLLLTRFAETPRISFGKVAVEASKEAILVVKNPLDDDLIVTVEKVPEKKGFSVDLEFFDVKKLSEQPVKIVWTPKEAGNYRELVTFRLNAIFCKQVILLGSAFSPLKRVLQPQNRTESQPRHPSKIKLTVKKGAKSKIASRKHQKTNENKLQMTFIQRKNLPGLRNLGEIDPNDTNQELNASIRTQPKMTHSPKATVYLRLTPDLQLRSSSSKPEQGLQPLHSCEDNLMLNRRHTYVSQPNRNRLIAPYSPKPRTSPEKFESCASLSEKKAVTLASKSPELIDRRQTYNKSEIPSLIPVHSCLSPDSSVSSLVSSKKSKIPEPIYKLKSRSRRHSDMSDFNDSLENDFTTDFTTDFSSVTTDDSDTKRSLEVANVAGEMNDRFDLPRLFGSEQTLQITELDYKDFCGNLNEGQSDWTELGVARPDEEEVLDCPSFRVRKCSTDRKVVARLCNVPSLDSRKGLFADKDSATTFSSDTFVMSKTSTSTSKESVFLQKRRSRKKSGIPSLQKKFSEAEEKTVIQAKTKRNSSKTSDSGSSKERGQKKKKTARAAMQQLDTGVAFRPKLTLIKPPSKALTPCHPNPYAAKNIYYDEQWIEKQTQGFTRWLNFILTIPDELGEGEKHKMSINAPMEFSRDITFKQAPSREELSIKTYTVQKKMNLVRRKACNLYQSESIIKVITRLEHEIENRRIAIRSDKALHADVGIKQKLVELILSYNNLWLRIGLETVFGQIIQLRSNNDTDGLSQFLLNYLMNSPIIAKEYAHPTVPHLFKPGFATSLKKHTLKKFLLLVYFLDHAKENYLIEFNPCLFNIQSKFKSSRDILLAFSRDHLSGEGDLTKHLAYFGYKVVHTQTALDEYDFSVSNLAVDLRNGLRLARAAQLLTRNWSVMTKLRVPAVTRMQKIHNVTCVLNTLAENDSAITDVTAKDIVNGHREKTLNLLWQLMFNFQVKLVLSEEKLKKELVVLKKSLRSRGIDDKKYASNNYKLFPDEKIELLLRWCQLVCAHYKIMVDNFTVSFSDGRVMCYLINYYHPDVLPEEDIKKETTQSYIVPYDSISSDDSFNLNWTSTLTTNDKQEELLQNEQDNFKLALSKIILCGGIPLMIKPNFMSNTIPDEKVTMVFVSYLCAQFIDLSIEIRAANVIQKAWRTYQAKCLEKSDLQSKIDAAIKIQRALRNHFRRPQRQTQTESARKIQRRFRSFLLRQQFIKARQDMIKLQATVRSKMARRRLKRMLRATIVIQKWTRMFIARKRYRLIKAEKNAAATTIQSAVREFLLRKRQRKDEAARVIQRAVRNYLRVKKIEELDLLLQEAERDAAATSIQSFWRMCAARVAYERQRGVVTKIQACSRGYLAREMVLRREKAANVIRTWFKRCIVARKTRARFVELKEAAIKVQRRYRSSRDAEVIRERFLSVKNAAVVVQNRWRSRKTAAATRDWFLRLKLSAVTIQRWFRRAKRTNEQDAVLKQASVVIQRWYRGLKEAREIRTRLLELKRNVITIQRWYRCAAEATRTRVEFLDLKWDVITIQRWFRRAAEANKIRVDFVNLKWDVITIQRWYRRCKEARKTRTRFLCLKVNVVTIQRWFRRCREARRVRMEFLELRRNVITIQRRYRMRFSERIRSVVVIQRWFRSNKKTRRVRSGFLKEKRAAVNVQQWFRSNKQTRNTRTEFLKQKQAAVTIQQWYRRTNEARRIRDEFLESKSNVATIQRWYRTTMKARQTRKDFLSRKQAAVIIQRRYREARRRREQRKRAALTIQLWYRRAIVARKNLTDFTELKRNTVLIQRWYRRCKQSEVTRREFVERKQAAICIQNWYRRSKRARNTRDEFLQRKRAAHVIKHWLRRTVRAKNARMQFIQTKQAATIVQRWYRGVAETKKKRELNRVVIVLQRWYRRCTEMKKYRTWFVEIKRTIIRIQQWYRSSKLAVQMRTQFVELKNSIVFIQKLYRLHRQRKRDRERFLELKQAAVTIQKWYRGVRAMRNDRDAFRSATKAVICIQRWYRRTKTAREIRNDYLHLVVNVVRVQRRFRGAVETRRLRIEFLEARRSAVIVQRWYRRSKESREIRVCKIQDWYRRCKKTRETRRGFLTIKRACVVIQRWFGRFKYVKEIEDLMDAVLCVQRWYRGWRETRRTRSVFLGIKMAAVFVQRRFRAKKCRARFLRAKMAAVSIQKWIRGRKIRREYLRMKSGVICIENWYLVVREGKRQRSRFLALRKAAICVQRGYRLHSAAKSLRKENWAAVTIQRYLSGWIHWKKFTEMKRASIIIQRQFRVAKLIKSETRSWAVVTIQTFFRGYLEARTARREFLRLRSAAVVVQRFVRSCLRAREDREALLTLTWAAGVVQDWFRTCNQRRAFKTMRKYAIIVQKNYRRKLYQREFLLIKRSALLIQTTWRRVVHSRAQKAAIYVQAAWRGYAERKKLEARSKAAVCIQKWYRNVRETRRIRAEFVATKSAVVKIQSCIRRRLAVRKYEQIRRSVVGLQRHCRVKTVMLSLYNKVWAIQVLQQHWTAVIAGRKTRKRFLEMKRAATTIQSWFRMLKCRREFATERNFAIKIQKTWRMFTARRNYLLQKRSALVVEEWVISNWERRITRESYLALKSGVVALQAMWRLYRRRKRARIENEAARTIQNWFYTCQLMGFCRAEYLELRYYTIRMQGIRRGTIGRRKILCMHEAAVVIQSAFRRWSERNNFRLMRGCAIVIQRFWRNCQLTRELNDEFTLKRSACIVLQAYIRGFLIRRRYLFVKYSAILVQSYIRGWSQRRRFLRLRAAVVAVQRCWRRRMLLRWQFTRYHVIRGAIIVIQSYLRGHIVRKIVKSKHCANSNKLCNLYDDLLRFKKWKDYHIVRGAAITIQAWARGWMTRVKLYEAKTDQRVNAVVKIQAAFRGVLTRRRLEKERCVCWKFRCNDHVNFAHCRRLRMLNAVGVIERYYQCYKVRQVELLPEKELKVKVRGFSKWTKRLLLQRRWFLVMRTAATIIQSAWQAWVLGRAVRGWFVRVREGTVGFQAAARGFLVRRAAEKKRRRGKLKAGGKCDFREEKIASRENYLKCFGAAAKLQLSAMRLQRWIRKWNEKRRDFCAVVIQAAWKGYKLRSALKDRRISDARSRINEANQSAILENTLWHRTTSGLDSLFNCRRLSTVWKALNNLNASTRLSPVCCERLSNSGGIVILYQIIEGCNRSVPHMEIILECLCILVNLAKHEPSRTQVWQPDGCGLTLVKLMRHYFEKNEKIVLKCCSLFWIICRDKSCVKLFAHDALMMKSTSNLCAAVSRRFPFRGAIESSPIKGSAWKKVSNRYNFKPDWVLGNDVDREFMVYVKAFPLVIDMMKSWL